MTSGLYRERANTEEPANVFHSGITRNDDYHNHALPLILPYFLIIVYSATAVEVTSGRAAEVNACNFSVKAGAPVAECCPGRADAPGRINALSISRSGRCGSQLSPSGQGSSGRVAQFRSSNGHS